MHNEAHEAVPIAGQRHWWIVGLMWPDVGTGPRWLITPLGGSSGLGWVLGISHTPKPLLSGTPRIFSKPNPRQTFGLRMILKLGIFQDPAVYAEESLKTYKYPSEAFTRVERFD